MADDTYAVTRTTTVAAPAEALYARLVDFHRWPEWSPWEGLDPALTRSYTGPESGVGAGYAWSGNRKAGRGRMSIADVTAPSRVAVDVMFEKPFPSSSSSVFTLAPEGTGTRVTWTMTGRKSLINRVMGIFVSMDKLIGPDFERGLAQLKSVAESS